MTQAIYPLNPYYAEYYKMLTEAYLDGYAGMSSQGMLFETVLLCHYNVETDEYVEEVCLSRYEANEMMRSYLKGGICAWIRYE